MRALNDLFGSVASWRFACLVLAALFAVRETALAQECSWRERSYGGGGRFTAVAVSPVDPNLVFIGSDVAGLFRSSDSGQSFKNLGNALEGLAVASIALDPETPGRLFVLTDDGLYLSPDDGTTLARISSKVRYTSRFFGSKLIVRFKGSWYAAGDADGVFRLTDQGGATWGATPVFGLEGKKVNALAATSDKLMAATDEGVYVHDGEIWKVLSEGYALSRRDIVDMVAHPSGRVYALEKHSGVYILNDRLNRFERRGPNLATVASQSGQPSFKSLSVAPDNPDVLFLGTHPGAWPNMLMRSQDGGRTFALVKRFTLEGSVQNWATDLEAIEQVGFSPNGRTAFLLDWWNVWRSADGGSSWLQVLKGLQNTVVNDVARDPAAANRLFVAADDNGLMTSNDDGKTWTRKMTGVLDGHAAAVRVSAKTPGLVYLLVNPWQSQDTADAKFFHLYKSLDGGEHWALHRIRDKKKVFEKPFADSRATGLAVDAADETVVYVATNGYGVYRVETGDSAQPPQGDAKAAQVAAGLPTPYLKGHGAFLVSARNPKVMLAAALEGGIFRSEDAGATWRLVAAPKAFVFDIAQDPDSPDVFYAAAAEKRLLKSLDGGLTWQWLNLPGPRPGHIAATAVAVGGGAVWVGTSGYDHRSGDGIFVSTDGAASFVKCPMAIPRAGVTVLVPVPGAAAPTALAGFNGLGVYEVAAPVKGR